MFDNRAISEMFDDRTALCFGETYVERRHTLDFYSNSVGTERDQLERAMRGAACLREKAFYAELIESCDIRLRRLYELMDINDAESPSVDPLSLGPPAIPTLESLSRVLSEYNNGV